MANSVCVCARVRVRGGQSSAAGQPVVFEGGASLLCVVCCYPHTGHTLAKSMSFPHHLNEIMLDRRGIDVELTSVPSGLFLL